MRVRLLWSFLVVSCVLVGMVEPARACTSDNECKGDRVCSAGACVAPTTPATCASDKDCPGDQVCTAQRCSAVTSPVVVPPTATQPMPPALGPALASGVQVSFAPAANHAYQVTVDTPGGLRQCLAPCSLAVEPGPRRVQITGDASFAQVVDVPAAGGNFVVEQKPPGRKTLWATMTLGGGAMTALGFYGFNQKNTFLAVVGLAGGGPIFLAGVLGLAMGDKGRGQNAIRPRAAAAGVRGSGVVLEGWGVAPVEGGVAGNAAFSF